MTAAKEQGPKICEVTGSGYEEMTERWKEKEGYTRGKAKGKNFKEELEDAFEDPRIQKKLHQRKLGESKNG